MGLLGPESETTLLAEDDERGRKYHARIIVDLSPGTYYARVHHYKPTGTGKYKIWVRSNYRKDILGAVRSTRGKRRMVYDHFSH